jgi:hypothetical protein
MALPTSIALSCGCSRFRGAAIAPLPEVECAPRTIGMMVLPAPITLLGAIAAARWLELRRNSVEDTALGRSR